MSTQRNRKEAAQIDRSPTEGRLRTGPASASVRPAVRKRPNVIVVEPRKTADRSVGCPVNVVPMPQVEVHKNRCVGTCSGEWFQEELKVVPAEMAEEASTGGAADNQPLSINQINTKTTVTN